MGTHNTTTVVRGLAAALAAGTLLLPVRAFPAPGDIFKQPAPVLGSDPPKAADLATGDVSVATSTGAATYSYPIRVPPGRNGVAPKLALSYSSQGATYGGIASGWSLPIGMIHEDTSEGRLRTHDTLIDWTEAFHGGDPAADDRFVSSIAGESRLVAVDEPHAADVYMTYRVAHGDASFTRYERLLPGQPARWRARTSDGSVLYFGEAANAPGCPISDGYAPLTRMADAFGNEISYTYAFAQGECIIDRIQWGQNPAAGLGAFAEAQFVRAAAPLCDGVATGSQTNYRSGQRIVTGANVINQIVVRAFDPTTLVTEHTRTISLSYAPYTCGYESHGPVRLLTAIQETASGIDAPAVTLPPVTFEYGDPVVSLSTAVLQGNPMGGLDPRPNNLGWGYRRNDDRWPTVEAMLVDLDGDGLLDRLANVSTPTIDGTCRASWQRNLGPDPATGLLHFGAPQEISLPRLKWNGDNASSPIDGSPTAEAASPYYEGCALNGQVTAFHNSQEQNNQFCHDESPCLASSDPDDPNLYCYPGGTDCPAGEGSGGGTEPFRTYLAYRWLDADGDGLTDLVAAVHGDIDHYDIEQGNLVPFLGHPEPPLFGAWPACPGEMDRCEDLDPACVLQDCPREQPCAFDPSTLNTCLDTAPTLGCDALLYGLPGGGGGGPGVTRGAYTRCEGLYPWFIYKGVGNGSFEPTPIIKYQPMPLESATGDSNFSGPVIAAQQQGLLDVDGDGWLDVVGHEPEDGDWWWSVWLGDGTGGFSPTKHVFHTRTDALISGSRMMGPLIGDQGLVDLNGDGLPDHWKQLAGETNANIAFNYGHEIRTFGPDGDGEITTLPGVSPLDDVITTVTKPPNWAPGQPVEEGTTVGHNRLVDVDHDGRPDVVTDVEARPLVHYNVGGQFASNGRLYPGDSNGLMRTTAALKPVELVWELKGDLVDLDGDGISESVWFSSTSSFHRLVHQSDAPPRLLKKITNGRGVEATLSYASMHSDVVEQHPELAWFDNRPMATPSTQWVVRSLTLADEFAGTTSTTSYAYRYPRHGADDQGHFAFRGFGEVEATGPSGARTLSRYGYDVDWSGRQIATLVFPGSGSEVHSIATTDWTARTLFGGTVDAIFATESHQRTCANGQDEAACMLDPAAHTRSVHVQTALASDSAPSGPPLLWAETEATVGLAAPGDGDRRTTTEPVLHADATKYLLRPVKTLRESMVGGAWVMFGETAKTWDATLRVPLTDEVWVNGVDDDRAITRFTYDLTTGNLLSRTKPEQDGVASTTFTYDSRKLFPATVVNELGHQVDFVYEYGTGTKLETLGPNVASNETKESHRVRVDGLGRVIEQWETIGPGSFYTSYKIGTTTYQEANLTAMPHVPASVTVRRLIEKNESVWTEDTAQLDGHGRPIKKTVSAQGSAPEDAVTTFVYRDDGTLASVSVPDPSKNDTSTVTYTYGFDSLGRATSIRRPDAALALDQSGVDISYEGLTKTVTEQVGAAGGQPASTISITDAFGRLVEVRELAAASPETWATTTYTYGPDDNVTQVVDPEGVTTTLTHDFAGHRTKIERHGRVWTYAYDKNGNLLREQVPGSPDAAHDLDYSTFIIYDALDRPISKVIGQRQLLPADQAEFGANTEVFTYDTALNAKGRLIRWETYAPDATTPTASEAFSYDGQGNRTSLHQTFDGAGYGGLARTFDQQRNLLGAPTLTNYYDHVGPFYYTQSKTHYDARGLPSSIDLIRTGNPTMSVAVQTRNVAGLVTDRFTDTTGSMNWIRSSWTYDALGRVTNQTVNKAIVTQVARQSLSYFGNDDPKTLTHYLAYTSKQFEFGYDPRHQLTSANEITTCYRSRFLTSGARA